ncbi:MAG TPA: TlpA disulfide reductase family protein [Bryobacteraceae bacterium]|nr:TlpA disulfide reductase family protein [Bryobacteraceae bacterium]
MLALPCAAGIVSDVRATLARHDLAGAERQVAEYRKRSGNTPEGLLALSWLGRGALEQKKYEEAERYASETTRLVGTLRPGADRNLTLALGSAIEVRAGVLAERGQRAEAVSYLRKQLAAYRNTDLHPRIQKSLNLLTLEGKPAPPLDTRRSLGARARPLAELRGRPVLLFFWAHWCPDCKDEIPVLVEIMRRYGPRGLVLIAPTQHYGYVARGEDAPPERETPYIDSVRRTAYRALGDVPVPLSEENFRVYGASTVPTLVLVDAAGVVRMYHPDVMPLEALAAQIEKVLPSRAAVLR